MYSMFSLKFIKLTILARKHVIKHNRSDFLERDFLIINNISNKMNVRNIVINEKLLGIKFNISREITYDTPIIANGRFIIFSPSFIKLKNKAFKL